MTSEKMATPNMSTKDQMRRSWMLTGLISPKPMVERVVRAKYHILMSRCRPVSISSHYPNLSVFPKKSGYDPSSFYSMYAYSKSQT